MYVHVLKSFFIDIEELQALVTLPEPLALHHRGNYLISSGY